MTTQPPADQAAHNQHTREAYDRLAAVWSATTDEGPYNGMLERPALRALVPTPLAGATVLDAGCGSGAQARWLLDQGAEVIGFDISPRMVEEAQRRCGGRGRFEVADLSRPLPLEPRSLDGITCSLALHYVEDWSVPLRLVRGRAAGGRLGGHLARPPVRAAGAQPARRLLRERAGQRHLAKGDVEVTQHFWRRPLTQVFGAFADAGFAVDRIAEPQPSPEALRQFPDDLAELVGVPNFIVYRLWLRG